MHCRTVAALVALPLLAIAACSDQAPLTPREPLGSVAAAAATCDAPGVRLGLAASLVDRTTRGRATALFNEGWNRDRAGDHATARARYYAVLNLVLGARAAGQTRDPNAVGSRQATNGVEGLTRALYACAGDAAPPNLREILSIPPGANDGDHTICTGAGDVSTTCVIPNQRIAVIAEPGFLTAPALFVLEPGPTYIDPNVEAAYGTQWSRSWRARVLPITAQANYPTPAPGGSAAAVVAVCVVDRLMGGQVVAHPSRSLLQVVARAEDTPAATPQLLPVQSLANGQDATALLDCDQPGGPTASRGSVGAFYAAARRLLAPRALHAFDGGIGGRVGAFRSYYAAVRPPVALFVFAGAPGSSGATPPTPVSNGQLTLAAGSMAMLQVSTSAGRLERATGCSWGYRPPDGSGAALLISDAVLARQSGTTWLRASCDAGTVDLRVVVP